MPTRAVRELEHLWIPVRDGCRLGARIWLPDDAEADPVPAILEYIPYRKADGTAIGDYPRHSYLASHGYAAVRVDLRGSGDSDGLLMDEYLPQEQEDAVDVIAWLAAQPWCSGTVGMFGISWGGFNALQVAALRPPALKAIITFCSTDDRYALDVHYIGGCVHAEAMLGWSSTFLARKSRAPDPAVVGEGWRERWLERLEGTPPFAGEWLRHQRRDDYWKQGSVCEDFGAIEAAVYAVGGWADGYTDAVPRLLEGLGAAGVPCKGIVGPWSHTYPEEGIPGPAVGFLQESLRWWDRWLKGADTGIDDEPVLRAWLQEPAPPAPFYAERPGRWVAEEAWPSPRIETHEYDLGFAGDDVCSPVAAGRWHGKWCPYGRGPEQPLDQRPADAVSLAWTSAPLDERLEVLGFPEVELELSADRPVAQAAVRLCDVAPDGASLYVAHGLLNLTHRDSHERPEPLEPGRRYRVTIPLKVCGHAFVPGHRLRVAVSSSYWPISWPAPEPVTLTLHAGRLRLPVRPPRAEDDGLAPFAPPETGTALAHEVLRPMRIEWDVREDVTTATTTITSSIDYGGRRRLLRDGTEFEATGPSQWTVVDGDPLTAAMRARRVDGYGRGAWQTRVETDSTLSADADAFHVTNVLEAFENDVRVFAKTWTERIPRDLA